jgi:MFS family permease
MEQRDFRNVRVISLSQLGIIFCSNFVMVFLPFFVHDISPESQEKTLIWVGCIMGAPPFAAALASTFWGSLTSRFSPKVLFLRGVFSHFIIILSMAFVTNLPILLTLRLIQGIMGGLSTVGLIIVSSSTSKRQPKNDPFRQPNFDPPCDLNVLLPIVIKSNRFCLIGLVTGAWRFQDAPVTSID